MERLTSSQTRVQEIQKQAKILENNIDSVQKLADQILQQKKTETKQLLMVGFLGLCGLAGAALAKAVCETVYHSFKR